MKVTPTKIPDALIIEPDVFGDDRGFFYESYNKKKFEQATGLDVEFVQDNHSRSTKGVLRGLHYQIRQPQGKLVRVTDGEVLDIVVDVRKSSATFGEWESIHLSADNKRQLWIPEGFAHGFIVVSESADFLYKTTDFYAPEHERCIRWDDESLGIDWQVDGDPLISDKDADGKSFTDAEYFE